MKGIGLVGALTRLDERGIRFDAVAGTSAGSLVAALYAAGYTAAELKEVLWKTDFGTLLDPAWPKFYHLWKNYGVHKGHKLYVWVFELLKKKGVVKFCDLKKPLTIIASDLTNREMLTFAQAGHPQMTVAEAVRMSIGIPLFFQAYRWGERLVVDGGVLSNYPLWVFASSADKTIGFKLVSSAGVPALPNAFVGYLGAILGTMLEAHDKEDQRSLAWGSTIHIPTGSIPSTKFHLNEEEKQNLFDRGYIAATRFVDSMEDALFGSPQRSLDEVGGVIDAAFAHLPPLSAWMPPPVGERVLSLEERARLEDADKTLGAWDQLRIAGNPTELATYFTKAALYWLYYGDYERAVERVERAVALDPSSAYAREQLGQTLSYLGADTLSDSPEKAKLLHRALHELERAKEMQGPNPRAETLHALAWTYDELANYRMAAGYYRQARAQVRGQEDAEIYTYNLACTLTKAGEFNDALSELKAIMNRGDLMLWAARDPDFKNLRASSLGPTFADLIREAKTKREL